MTEHRGGNLRHDPLEQHQRRGGVLDFSPLHERDPRNFFEHFDVRLDQVGVSQPLGAVLMARSILPPGSIGLGPGVPPVYLGNLDDSTMTVSYRDHKGKDQAVA